MLKINFVLSFAVAYLAVARGYDGLTMKDLPEDISKQLKFLLTSPIIKFQPNCSTPQNPEVKFLLYNRDFPNLPIVLDPENPSQIQPRKKIIIILHGWLSKPSYSKITDLKNAYIRRYDGNIILVDWAKSAFNLYEDVYCNTTDVAHKVSDFLCKLSDRFNLHLSVIHMLGHSMGGQIAGHAGKQVIKKCGMKVGRITGLDPAGPLFENKPKGERLDESDAEFVDVIHSSGLVGVGYYTKCGHVDFHPNCDLYPQPGCISSSNVKNETLVTDALCADDRALELMTESVYSTDLVAVSCSMCPRYCSKDIINEVYQVMGEDCREIPKPAKNFYIPTNKKYPYGQGWVPYPPQKQSGLVGFCKIIKEWPLAIFKNLCN